jgi:predicted RNase H-like HicB family nuclease
MKNKHAIHIKGKGMKTYVFRVVIEPDEDRWSAYCPALRQYAAMTWGNTQEETLKHIREVVQMVVVRKIIAAFSPLCAATTLSRSPVEIRRVHPWLR